MVGGAPPRYEAAMRTLRYSLVDVFTNRPLTGNPLAVFTGAGDVSDATLQAIAREMNLSETVFVFPPSAGGQARLRIFTPKVELPFAGHPVLGAAGVIGRSVQTNPVELETGAGVIPVHVEREGADVREASMTVPVPKISTWETQAELLSALGVAKARLPIELYDLGPRHVLVALDDVAELRGLQPDLAKVAALHAGGVLVFAKSGDGFEARSFAPGAGVAEDPATGSAAGPLALHACRHGWAKWGQTVEIAQGEALERPSRLFATAEGSANGCSALTVAGGVVLIGRGELRLPF